MSISSRPSPYLTTALTVFTYVAAAAVALGGVAMLVAWAMRIAAMNRHGYSGPVSMNPMTALGMILAAVALAARISPSPGRWLRAVAVVSASLVILLGVMKIAAFVGPSRPRENVMTPNTSVALVLTGLSILMLDVRTRNGHRPAVVAALATATIASLALTGYLYHATLFDRISAYIPMALNTAVGFMLLSLGTLAARPREEPMATFLSDTAGGVVARRLIPFALVPLALGWLSLKGQRAGLYSTDVGETIYSLVKTIVFIALIWWIARSLQRLDLARQKAQSVAADEHQLLRTLIDNLPDHVFVKDKNGRFLLNNRAHARALGAPSPESMGGKTDADFFNPELAAAYRAGDRRVLETGQPTIDQEERTTDAAGRAYWVSTTKAPFRNSAGEIVGIVAIAHDITERRRAEEERDRFFTLSLDLVCVGGFDGYFKRVNSAWETTLGYTLEELQSRPWIDFIHPDDRAATLAEGKKLALGSVTLYFENRYRTKDGSYRWLSWTAVPVVKDQRIYAVARDTTLAKQTEEQLREANRKLDEAVRSERQAHEVLKAAQSQIVQTEKLAGLGQMVAGVAHEINNPLSFVVNNVAVLQRDLRGVLRLLELYERADPVLHAHAPEKLKDVRELAARIDLGYTTVNLQEMLARSRDGLKRIQQIVKDLRDFARLDEADLHEVDLNEGIQSTVNIILGYAKKKQVQIETDLAPLPPVTCYPAKVNQVVMNLLTNAIDASNDAGAVAVRTRAENGDVRIEVSDSGAGIDPAVRGRIFDPFFTTKRPGEGTGLGLSISYGIIQEHGGSIDVRSEVGKGSTFTVTLPVKGGDEKREARG